MFIEVPEQAMTVHTVCDCAAEGVKNQHPCFVFPWTCVPAESAWTEEEDSEYPDPDAYYEMLRDQRGGL